jgi:hypothetical protein
MTNFKLLIFVILITAVHQTWFKSNPLVYGQLEYTSPVADNYGDMVILNGATPGEFQFIMMPTPANTASATSRFTKFKYKHGALTELESVATPTGSKFSVSAIVQDGSFVVCRLTGSPDATCSRYAGANLTATPDTLLATGQDATATYAGVGSNVIVVVDSSNFFLVSAANNILKFDTNTTGYHNQGIPMFVIIPPSPAPSMNGLLFMHH